MATYTDILNTPLNEVTEPQPLPVGTYVGTVKAMPKVDKGGKNNNDFAEVEFSLVAAQADVNPDELAAAGGLPRDFSHTFWITPKSSFMVKRFLIAAGAVDENSAASIGEGLTQVQGRSVTLTIGMGRPSPKTGKAYPEVKTFAAA